MLRNAPLIVALMDMNENQSHNHNILAQSCPKLLEIRIDYLALKMFLKYEIHGAVILKVIYSFFKSNVHLKMTRPESLNKCGKERANVNKSG